MIVRFVIASIFSSLGFLCSETLQAYSLLKNYATSVKDLIESNFDVKIHTL